jgi:hypothetical protein
MKTKTIISLLLAMLFGTIVSFAVGIPPAAGVIGAVSFNIAYNLSVQKGLILPVFRGALLFNLANLEWDNGQDNIPGTIPIAYFAIKSDIDNFPALVSSPSTLGEHGKLESSVGFTFLQNGFFKIYGTEGSGKLSSEPQGEMDCKSFLNKYTFRYPGTTAEALGLCRQLNNSDAAFLVKAADGTVHMIGHETLRAVVAANVDSGDARTSSKGVTIEISCTHEAPIPIYEGDITLADASS